MEANAVPSRGAVLRRLLARPGQPLPILGIPDASTARIMAANGVEAAFIGGALTGSRYTGLPDTGVITSTEALWIATFIARSVDIPIIFDGDTGHGGAPAIKRLVQECIRIGIAGIRIDDQVIESFGGDDIEVVSRDQAVARYRAAVEARDEMDPNFVVMAQSFARDAVNGGLEEVIERVRLYEQDGGVDWVQFESPHSLEEIKQARAAVKGILSVAREKLSQPLTLDELGGLGLDAAWLTSWPVSVIQAATRAIMADYKERGVQAFVDYQARASH